MGKASNIADRLEAEFGLMWDKAEYGGIELNAPAATVLRDLGREAARELRRVAGLLERRESSRPGDYRCKGCGRMVGFGHQCDL